MATPPWFPLYVGDYLRDTMHLSTRQHGAYMLLLMAQWTNGPLPDDDEQLAAITRSSVDDWQTLRPVIFKFFQVSGGRIWNRRLEAERKRTATAISRRSHAGAQGAEKRWKNSKRNADAMRTQWQTDGNHIHKDPYQGRERVVEPSSPLSTDSLGGEVVRLPLPGRRTADGSGQ